MKEDYLWDKTGEPDPEIQELERVLGTLRYQPRPLDIPAGVAPDRKHTVLPRLPRLPRLLAIAATIAIMLLGIGLWVGLQKTQTTQVAREGSKPVTGGTPQTGVTPKKESTPATGLQSTNQSDKRVRHRVSPGSISHQLATNRRPKLNTPELTIEERKEAEAAKEQLMLALRVASSKLNFAQKKAQEINTPNQTHNQHKVG